MTNGGQALEGSGPASAPHLSNKHVPTHHKFPVRRTGLGKSAFLLKDVKLNGIAGVCLPRLPRPERSPPESVCHRDQSVPRGASWPRLPKARWSQDLCHVLFDKASSEPLSPTTGLRISPLLQRGGSSVAMLLRQSRPTSLFPVLIAETNLNQEYHYGP